VPKFLETVPHIASFINGDTRPLPPPNAYELTIGYYWLEMIVYGSLNTCVSRKEPSEAEGSDWLNPLFLPRSKSLQK
jgi:hypothetical protein